MSWYGETMMDDFERRQGNVFKIGDRAKVAKKLEGRERFYGHVGAVYLKWPNNEVSLYFSDAEFARFPNSALRNVTQIPTPEDMRTVGEWLRDKRKQPKKRVRRIR